MTTPAATPAPAAARPRRSWLGLPPIELASVLVLSALPLAASYAGCWRVAVAEAWGFATGLLCVWLAVRERPANWPIGLANNVLFSILFFRARLFADMGLQAAYFGLGVYGWFNWLFGGAGRTALRISRTTRSEWVALGAAVPLGTWSLREILVAANGAAPLADALTTALSLSAQYLLTRKRLENWLFWITADAIYVPLYLSRGLPLTAVLYGVFLLLCLVGLRTWRRR